MRAWFYGPGGQAAIFADERQVPDGWRDHPFADGPGGPAQHEKVRAPMRPRKAKS